MTAPTRTISPSLLDVAWAAGIFEGEGTVASSSDSQRIIVIQKDRWILDRLRERFGGSIYLKEQESICHWYLTGARARGFAYTIYTWLSPHRRQQVRRKLLGIVEETVAA